MFIPLTNKEAMIKINDPVAWKKFLEELSEAVADAQASGGVYSAFLPHKHGTLQVSFGFPLAVCAKKRRKTRTTTPKATTKPDTTRGSHPVRYTDKKRGRPKGSKNKPKVKK